MCVSVCFFYFFIAGYFYNEDMRDLNETELPFSLFSTGIVFFILIISQCQVGGLSARARVRFVLWSSPVITPRTFD